MGISRVYNHAEMAAKKILCFDVFALAIILVLCVSYISSERLDNDRADSLKNEDLGVSNCDYDPSVKNEEHMVSNCGDKATREKRGIKFRMPKIKSTAPKTAPKPPANKLPDGHTKHAAPKTEDIAIPGLIKQKAKSSVQGGGAKRERWVDAKNKKTYEHDKQHGDLEVYRNSDKKHLGSVDPATGQQTKGPVKGRKLKDH